MPPVRVSNVTKAKAALQAYYRGEVELVQRRLDASGVFAYVAVKRHVVKPPRVPARLVDFVQHLVFGKEGAA
jgi:hypothetical protein